MKGDIDIEDLIADEDAVVVYTRSGYIKRQTVDNYRAQRRGGKGIRGMNLKEEDVVEKLFIASTLSHLLVFTSIGKDSCAQGLFHSRSEPDRKRKIYC